MGSSETDKPAKEANTPSPVSVATYSPIPPPGFMASNPQAHPYMWGVQHVMPPYGTSPHPYVAMYPHGGVYAHPTMPPGSYPYAPYAIPSTNGMVEALVNTNGSADGDNKQPEAKEKLPVKRMRGSLGSLKMITGKTNEESKRSGTQANGACSKSGKSASDGSSDGSDADSQNDSPMKSGRQEAGEADVSQNGMEYWGAPASSPFPALQGKVSAGSRDNLQSQLCVQDERELKRQRRKQSNRESARRSRLRKQAECDELAQRAEVLREENANLRSELNRIKSECDRLMTENATLKARVGKTHEDVGSVRAELCLANEAREIVKTDPTQSTL